MSRVESASPVLVVTDDPDLAEQTLRLCAAVGATADVVPGSRSIGLPAWRSASAVLVGADTAAALSGMRLPLRDGVLLVCAGAPAASTWQAAVTLRAESVGGLPAAAPELVRRLGDLLDGAHSTCLTVGVVGARGGSGASTLATGLAVTSARCRAPTLLVDGDPLGGGIDLVAGVEDVPGLRWPDVASAAGRVSSAALRAALPAVDDLAVLSWDRSSDAAVDVSVVHSILAAGQRGARLMVVDLPRALSQLSLAAAAVCDVILLLCTGDVRAAAGAVRLLSSLQQLGGDVKVVTRSGIGALDADAVAGLLGLPLLGHIPTRASVARLIDEGLGISARGCFTAACRALLTDLGVLEVAR